MRRTLCAALWLMAVACGALAPAPVARPTSLQRGSSAAAASSGLVPDTTDASFAIGVERGDAEDEGRFGERTPAEASPGEGGAGASASEPTGSRASAIDAAASCNEQPAQDFLVRANFLKQGEAGRRRAIQYRTDEYGYFEGFGRPSPGARPPSAFLATVTFMGLRVRMHERVAPALRCVEAEIRRACADHPYTPHALAGIRYRNTYRGGEVTNHAYGIAIDIDPDINTCCGCVKPWNDAPACKRQVRSEYDRMAMPECWVHAFERYGFYWLGHDVLRDTMHFEFLGDPDRILKEGDRGVVPSERPPIGGDRRGGGT